MTSESGDGSDERTDAESDTRRLILDAAAEVFREKGYSGTRVVDIARRAGYTSGALYGYFDSRADLLAEAIVGASTDMLASLLGGGTDDRAARGDGSPIDAVAVLDAALDRLTEPIDDVDQMVLDGVAIAHREPEAAGHLATELGRFRAELEGGRALASGGADLLVILVLGITSARALGLHDAPPEQLRDSLARCLVPDDQAVSSRVPGKSPHCSDSVGPTN